MLILIFISVQTYFLSEICDIWRKLCEVLRRVIFFCTSIEYSVNTFRLILFITSVTTSISHFNFCLDDLSIERGLLKSPSSSV